MIPDSVLLMIGPILLAHAIGDYILQSDWMAVEKTKHLGPAIVHGVAYTVPFLLLTHDWRILAIVAGTHVVIDRWRLARYLVWAKNWVAPIRVRRGENARFTFGSYNPPWSECRATGYDRARPVWLTTWLLFIADNTVHVVIAVAAFWWFGLA